MKEAGRKLATSLVVNEISVPCQMAPEIIVKDIVLMDSFFTGK